MAVLTIVGNGALTVLKSLRRPAMKFVDSGVTALGFMAGAVVGQAVWNRFYPEQEIRVEKSTSTKNSRRGKRTVTKERQVVTEKVKNGARPDRKLKKSAVV